MQTAIRYLANNWKSLTLVYFILQVIILFSIPFSYRSDSLYYYNLAQQCLTAHHIYPLPQHLYEDYIIYPLYINILVLILSLYNSVFMIGVFNIFFNMLQLFFVRGIVKTIFGEGASRIAVVSYVFYLSTIGQLLLNLTELSFGCFIFGGIYFFLKKRGIAYFISGILVAASVGIRPLGWNLLIILFLMSLFLIFKNREETRSIFFTIGVLLFLISFGSLTYSGFGDFVITSTNGPINILIGANDMATGAYNAKVFNRGNAGYIDSTQVLTIYDKEKFWKEQAITWIQKNPIKWLSLFPMKLVHMFAWDDFSVSFLFEKGNWNLYRIGKTFFAEKSFAHVLTELTLIEKMLYIFLQIIHHLYYYLLLFLFVSFSIKANKQLFIRKEVFILISFLVMGLFVNMMTFGDSRFKYPYMVIMIILVSEYIFKRVNKNNICKINVAQ